MLRVYQSTDVRLWVRKSQRLTQKRPANGSSMARPGWMRRGVLSRRSADVRVGFASSMVTGRKVDSDLLERLEVVAGLGSDSRLGGYTRTKAYGTSLSVAVIADKLPKEEFLLVCVEGLVRSKTEFETRLSSWRTHLQILESLDGTE